MPKKEYSQNAETVLPALIHNIKIILFVKDLFYKTERSMFNSESGKKCGILLCLHNEGQAQKTGREISEE